MPSLKIMLLGTLTSLAMGAQAIPLDTRFDASWSLAEPTFINGLGGGGSTAAAGAWASDIQTSTFVASGPDFSGGAGNTSQGHSQSLGGTSVENTSSIPWAIGAPWSVSATVDAHTLTASGVLSLNSGYAESIAMWHRDFTLNPHSSVRFGGVFSGEVTGPGQSGFAPHPSIQTFEDQHRFEGPDPDTFYSYTSLRINDRQDPQGNQLSIFLGATVFGPQPQGGHITYDMNPTGLVSMTIANGSSAVVSGSLDASVKVFAMPAVPEPATQLSLLAGLGVIGAAARRLRQKQNLTDRMDTDRPRARSDTALG